MKKLLAGALVTLSFLSCQTSERSVTQPSEITQGSSETSGRQLELRPETDWGHWRLGHRSDADFLESNKFTVTFAPGSPEFERADRQTFEQITEQSKQIIREFHERGYIVLRYMTSSVHGTSPTSTSNPEDHQLDLFHFYHNDRWSEYEDFLGPKPPSDQDPSTWLMRRPDGTFPYYRYAPYGQETSGRFEAWGCPNNPHFRNLMGAKLRAQAATGINGVYLDWTQIAGETCYCEHCVKGFRNHLRENLPESSAQFKYQVSDFGIVRPPHTHEEPFWMEWVEYRAHTLANFHKYLRAEARTVSPYFMISGNVYGGFGYGPIAYDAAGHMELFGREGGHDFLYSEIQEYLDTAPHLPEEGVRITNSPALKYLAAVSKGKPVVIYATEITEPIFPDPSEQALNAMALINIAESMANQAIFREKRLTPEWATAIYNFMAENHRSLVGARLHGSVAVVASIHQYLADQQSYAFSTSRVLSDEGVHHVFLVEDDLLNVDLTSYRVIILPQLQLLGEQHQRKLADFVSRGGKLIQIGSNGTHDQNNVPYSTVRLAEVESIRIAVPEKENNYLIPSALSGDYTTFGPTLSDRFADIPEGYTRGRIDPDLRKILEQAAQSVVEVHSSVTRRMSDHPHIEISTMLNPVEHQLLVHIINYDVSINGVVNTANDVQLQIEIPEGYRVGSLRYSNDMKEFENIRVSDTQGTLQLHVNEVGIYALLLAELIKE